MSGNLEKISCEMQEVMNKTSKNPAYDKSIPTFLKAYEAIDKAVEKAKLAEGIKVERSWHFYSPISSNFSRYDYVIAKKLSSKFKVEKPFTIEDIEKLLNVVPESLVFIPKISKAIKKVRTNHELKRLHKKGFLDERMTLTGEGKKKKEYQINGMGYYILNFYEKTHKV